ncbi:protein FMC1 homolog [Bacillus rossius redtenbacheri]|uniref:protein FMC1 homolog n=1 Tax=Bacillus rossius redtenbacheri TaxID=93214 RepID=UPI002FDF057C
MSSPGVTRMLHQLSHELRRRGTHAHVRDSLALKYALAQGRRYRQTDQQLCKAREEVRFLGETYLCYLRSSRLYQNLYDHYRGKGERSVDETAGLVGFKLPPDQK